MTHRFQAGGTPLSNFSANGEAHRFKLLIRVVMVNDDGKLTFPTRELWGKANGDATTGALEFLQNKVNSPEDDEEEGIDTIAEANEAMIGRDWLRSLNPRSPLVALSFSPIMSAATVISYSIAYQLGYTFAPDSKRSIRYTIAMFTHNALTRVIHATGPPCALQ